MNQQVFISYAKENEKVADTIYDTLKARGIPCWVAYKDLKGGQRWPDEISKAISNSRVMIVVLSEYAQKSDYVSMEVTKAAKEKLTIIPFCIEKVSLSGALDLLLGNRHWINANPHLQDNDLDQLVMTLHSHLGIETGKTLKKEEKPLEVSKQSFQKKKVYNPNASLRRKPVLVAASIIIAVIAAVFFIGQWTSNPGTSNPRTTPVMKTTEEPGNTLADKTIKTQPVEEAPKSTVAKSAMDKQEKTVTEPAANRQTKASSKPITKKETSKPPDKNRTDKKVSIKEEPDFISDLKSKGWDVKKNENGFWEALYKKYDLSMIYIPPGKFMMGADDGDKDEKPAHEVDLDGYWIGKYEVTFAQYDRYCEETGKEKPGDGGWGREKRPVIYVSWDDAVAYCQWLSRETGLTFQLPTEAQWEKAARGTGGLIYPWGNVFDKNKCNSDESGLEKTMPVGSYPSGKSPYGCMDMAGNVWEWCSDWYDADYYKNSPAKNPQGPSTGTYRALRGGSWNGLSVYLPCAARYGALPRDYWGTSGFRVVRSPFPSHTP